jgi:membrane fusion protein, multidrug efflux system
LALVRDPRFAPASAKQAVKAYTPQKEADLSITSSADPTQPATSLPVPRARGRLGRLQLLLIAVLAAVGCAGWYGYNWLTVGRFVVSTDDAYVRAHNTTLAAKVSGYLASIDVEDNAPVHAGDVIARIDDGDYVLAVNSARGKVASQEAAVEQIGRQIAAQQANVDQANAQLASVYAVRKQSESEYERQQSLATKAFASRQTLEKALATRDQAIAAVESAQAGLEAAMANVDVLKAQQQEAARILGEFKTALVRAERELSFAVVRAPVDGVFSNRALQTGDYVQPGQRLASLVPLHDVFIDANFKETQLERLRPGQPVDISIDALAGSSVRGIIESISPASGSVFSLLPPDNATGNFTKIVQRLPVRIRMPDDVARQQVLRPGMSVVVSVNTKPHTAAGVSHTKTSLLGAGTISKMETP